jgi:hypothetical protein
VNIKQNFENVFINQRRNRMRLITKEIIFEALKDTEFVNFFSEEKLISKIADKLHETFDFKYEFENMIEIIIEKTIDSFPKAIVSHEIIENNEVFINVDKQTYKTVKYQTFVMTLQTEILWKQNFNGFYFGEIDEY